jgi:S-adenosylmethionine synthetase
MAPFPIVIERLRQPTADEHQIEVVERKGLGHPDSICDAVMERVAVELNQAYRARFGRVLHNNIDKGFLVAGQVARRFGGGEVVRPMRLLIGDRATLVAAGTTIPVDEIAVAAAKRWIVEHLRHVDPERHITYEVVLAPGSEELVDLFAREGKMAEANDTSAAVGYAPLTPTETLVLDVEAYLNSPDYKRRFPETGEDVKVMAFRHGRQVHLTVAMPLLCASVSSEAAYFRRKADIQEDLAATFAEPRGLERVSIGLNLLDREGRGLHGTYLSLLGTSAEDADSGQVGRGNRVNGLIPLNRPASNEAAAGKNPVSHVGKIYNVLAHRIAATLHRELPEIREVTVWLMSQIGRPVDQPWSAIQVNLREGFELGEVAPGIRALLEQAMDPANPFYEELVQGRYPVC